MQSKHPALLLGLFGFASAHFFPGIALAQPSEDTLSHATYRVTITNLTRSQSFGLPLAVTHDGSVTIFEPGRPASPELAMLAEDGNSRPLAATLRASATVQDVAVGTAPVAPGESVSFMLKGWPGRSEVSVLGMLGTTNDTFGAAVRLPVPYRGSVMTYGVAYDAGSERNSELCAFIPGPPCGNPGKRDTNGAEGYVYVSSGIHGVGDLPAEIWDWNNPVIRVEVKQIH